MRLGAVSAVMAPPKRLRFTRDRAMVPVGDQAENSNDRHIHTERSLLHNCKYHYAIQGLRRRLPLRRRYGSTATYREFLRFLLLFLLPPLGYRISQRGHESLLFPQQNNEDDL